VAAKEDLRVEVLLQKLQAKVGDVSGLSSLHDDDPVLRLKVEDLINGDDAIDASLLDRDAL